MKNLYDIAKAHLDISNVVPILLNFEKRNIKLTDKTLESLVIGAKHADTLNYKKVYEENFLNGLIRSNSIIAGFLESVNINLQDLLKTLDLGTKILEKNFYSNRIYKSKNHTWKPFKHVGESIGYFSKRKGIIEKLENIKEEIKTDQLFNILLDEPVVWKSFKDMGISVNEIHRYLKLAKIAEPKYDIQKFIMWYNGDKIKLDVFNLADLMCLSEKENTTFSPYKFSIISTEKFYLNKQIEHFEWLINKNNVTEYDIQKFIEKNPWFLLGIEYKNLHSQLILTREDKNNLKPDFMLEKLNGNFVDIIELKKPQEKLVTGINDRRTFSHAMISALAQLREYRNYFEDSSNRNNFYFRYGLHAYKPKISVIIGRSYDFQNEAERINLMDEFKNLNLLTFDDLVLKAKNRLAIL